MKHSIKATALLLSILIYLPACGVLTATPTGAVRNPSRASAGEDAEYSFRQEVVGYAQELLGTKYRAGGKDPRGFDCSGFTGYVMKNFDLKLSASSRHQAQEGRKVNIKDVKPGDLIFFKRSPNGEIFHVSMVVRNSKAGIEVIHSTSRGVVIDNISKSSYWEPKIYSARDVLSKQKP